MKARSPFKVVRDGNEVGEWILEFQGREVGRIIKNIDDSDARGTGDIVTLGFMVIIDADSSHIDIDADYGAANVRLAFRNAKEFAFEHLAKLLAEGVEL
jgi:hypothetical protein